MPDGMSKEDAEVEWNGKVALMIKEKFGLGEGPDVILEVYGCSVLHTDWYPVGEEGWHVRASGDGKREVRCRDNFCSRESMLTCVPQNVTFPITTACIRDLTIRGSIRYTADCYSTASSTWWPVERSILRSSSHIVYAFEDSEQAFETVRKGGVSMS